ncbi:hypothetical protein LTR66_000380 [Elasticomyces elasticus]|nr:hypothetical protein LTR66_000380 [Elasticomyces elasticus]
MNKELRRRCNRQMKDFKDLNATYSPSPRLVEFADEDNSIVILVIWVSFTHKEAREALDEALNAPLEVDNTDDTETEEDAKIEDSNIKESDKDAANSDTSVEVEDLNDKEKNEKERKILLEKFGGRQ